MASVPGGGLVSIPPMSPMTMAAAAAAAAGMTPQLQPQTLGATMLQSAAVGTPISTMFTGSPSMQPIISTMAAATGNISQSPQSFPIISSLANLPVTASNELSSNLMNGANDGSCSNVSMSPSRSQSSDSPPALSIGGNTVGGGGRCTPGSVMGLMSAEEEKNNAEFLKELIAEKDSLDAASEDTVLKFNTTKLLEQGRNILLLFA